MHRILARMRDIASDRRPASVVSSQQSLSASIPHAEPEPEPPVVSPPSSSSVKTGDITATDLNAQLAEVEQQRDSVVGLMEKGTY